MTTTKTRPAFQLNSDNDYIYWTAEHVPAAVRFPRSLRVHRLVVGFGGLLVGACGAGGSSRGPLGIPTAGTVTCPKCQAL